MRPIVDVAKDLGLDWQDLEPYGRDKAKIPLDAFPTNNSPGTLIVITAITPTPAEEGKSTTAIGLTQGLSKIGKQTALTIRQPSLGPVFGHKGGGTGGGKATVQPATDINLHLTGDFHAVESAHNLLAAMTDNTAYRGLIENFEASGITWRRVTDAEDRALRHIVAGINGQVNGPLRQTGYDISAASEIGAIIALASDYKDLRRRLENILVGWTKDRKPVRAKDIQAVGSMMALLRDAMKPNLCQTVEGQPAIVHMGPFGNIAHGCNSIVADILAQATSDYVVTEAGFGSDLGFEKFMNIKVRQGGPTPTVAVIVCTVRGLKWHGGIQMRDLDLKNVAAITKGAENLEHAVRVVRTFGITPVVAINRFPNDTRAEVSEIKRVAHTYGAVSVAEAKGFAEGGEGMRELAEAVVDAARQPCKAKLLYKDDVHLTEKIETIAKKIYRASKVDWAPMTRTTAKRFEDNGWNFPICMAKTHLSVTADKKLLGAPTGHRFPIRELRVAAGAQQVIAYAGDIMTLPGLPSNPNAWDIDLDPNGLITGVLGT